MTRASACTRRTRSPSGKVPNDARLLAFVPRVGRLCRAAFVRSRTWYNVVVVALARGPSGAKTVAVRVDEGVYTALHPARKNVGDGFDMPWDVPFSAGQPLGGQPCFRPTKGSSCPDPNPTPRGAARRLKEKARSKERRRRKRRCKRAGRGVPLFVSSLATVCPYDWIRSWLCGGTSVAALPTLACVAPTLGCALYAVRGGIALATLTRPPTAALAQRTVKAALLMGVAPAAIASACSAAARGALVDSDSGVRRGAKRPSTTVTVSGTGRHATVAIDPGAVVHLVPILTGGGCKLLAERDTRDAAASVWLVSGSLNGAVYELDPNTDTQHAALLVRLKGANAYKVPTHAGARCHAPAHASGQPCTCATSPWPNAQRAAPVATLRRC